MFIATDPDGLQKSLGSQESLKNEITQEFLIYHFEYRDGNLWWKVPTARAVKVGQQFGTKHNKGYRQGRVKGKLILEHRLIWFMFKGYWPKEIDHENGIKDDNRLNNLRELTHQKNMLNQGSRGGTSKHRGIFWSKDHSKWRVKFCVNGNYHHVGMFLTEDEALEASNKFIESVEYSRSNEQ